MKIQNPKWDQENLPRYHVIHDVIDNSKDSQKSAKYSKLIIHFNKSRFFVTSSVDFPKFCHNIFADN